MSKMYINEVLKLIEEGLTVSQIAKKIGLSISRTSEILKKLYIEGYIQPVSRYPRLYKLTHKGRYFLRFSDLHGGTLRWFWRVENLRFSCKVVFRGFDFMGFRDRWVDWGNGSGFYNLRVDDVSIQVFRNGFALIILPRYENIESSDLLSHVFRDLYKAISYLYNIGIVVDLDSIKQVNQEYAFNHGYLDDVLRGRPKKARVELDRDARGLFNKLDQKAKAWIDRSYGDLEIETNDLEYARRLLLMPEIIYNLDKKLAPILEELSNQIRLHLEVMQDIRDYIRELRDLQRRPSLLDKIKSWFRRLI